MGQYALTARSVDRWSTGVFLNPTPSEKDRILFRAAVIVLVSRRRRRGVIPLETAPGPAVCARQPPALLLHRAKLALDASARHRCSSSCYHRQHDGRQQQWQRRPVHCGEVRDIGTGQSRRPSCQQRHEQASMLRPVSEAGRLWWVDVGRRAVARGCRPQMTFLPGARPRQPRPIR